MTVSAVMAELESFGSESIKKVLLKHGVKEPFFGVKIEHLKTIQKRVKKDYVLAKELYATGNADAMYLAGLITDDEKMTKDDLNNWVRQAVSNNISDYTVPWVAAEGKYGYELALKWIDSPEEHVAAAGWATLGNLAALKPDNELDRAGYKNLLQRVVQTIHSAPNHMRSRMNNFVISTGSYIAGLTEDAMAAANEIGTVMIDTNGTACKVPQAMDYIMKAKSKGTLGKKKKTMKC